MSNVAARFVVSPSSPIETKFEVNVQSNEHNLLQNRDLPDQHPMGAITGLQEALLEKQDVISDLQTIRSGAALGSTAVQPSDLDSYATQNWVENQGYLTEIPSEYVTDSELTAKGYQTAAQVETAITSKGYTTMSAVEAKGYITNDALNGYATETYVDTGLSQKQNQLSQTQLDAVNSGANTTNIGQIATNTSNIADINDLIPSQATSLNQLADKDFVNSSINNMAAFYITSDVAGDPFATRAALIAGPYYFRGQLRTPTQNDYALVSEDETHDDLTSRYMYDGGQWVWQYTLNNTKFTQAQIDAINSGITDVLVAKITTNETAINNHIADKTNPHEVTKAQVGLGNVDNTSDLNKPISTATQTALNGKQNTISDLAAIRSGAELGATAVQPAALATVATTGAYSDLSGTPTIPTVNNPTITITQGGVTKGSFTLNQASGDTIALDEGGSSYTAGTGISIASDVISVDSTVVTTGTNQDITAIKTFVGEKRIKFKQQTSSNKLGFTLYNNLGGEVGAFEYRPNTINGKAFIELNAAHGNAYVGFRYWSTTVNIVAPMAAAGTYFIPINLTDGNTTVTANDVGTVDISSLLPTVDQTYDGTSANAQSGVAVASAIENIATQLVAAINTKQDILTAGTGIDITNDVISIDSETTSEIMLATVATSGSYNDLIDKPTIPTVNNATLTITQGGVSKGTFTANASSDVTIALDAGGGGGAVDSVNGYTGVVVLAPSDLGITEYTANEVETLWSSL